MQIRPERPGDEAAIAELITAAFDGAAHSDGTEAAIVERLRAAGALAVALVAEDGGIVGHVAFSPVRIDGADTDWFGLGPVAVAPNRQGTGIGAALVTAGLERLREAGAAGCVVLGDPAYYGRFGFRAEPSLMFPGPPAAYFQALAFGSDAPAGVVAYHPAFG